MTRPDNRGFLAFSQEANRLKALIALALLSNTCSQTTLTGSSKINVVPPTAKLELDCRLLPDEELLQLLSELATIINDDNIKITNIMGFTPAISKTDTPLLGCDSANGDQQYGKCCLAPKCFNRFTDSHFFRDVGIVSFGFAPFLPLEGEATGVHGNNERISIENLRRGTKIMTDFLFEFATD